MARIKFMNTEIDNLTMQEWLDEIFSGLKIRYDDRKTHKNGLEKMVLCRSFCIVISSL